MRSRSPTNILLLVFFLAVALVFPVLALDEPSRKQFDQLLGESKYLSAWQLAERLDPDNTDLDLVIIKGHCLVQALVRSSDPEVFLLKDGMTDDVDFASSTAEGLVSIKFPLMDTLRAYIRMYPENQALQILLGSGNYQLFRAASRGNGQESVFAKEALIAYQRSLQLGADDVKVLWRIGILLTFSGDYHQAIYLLKQAGAKEPPSPELRYDLAYVLWLKGDFSAALEQVKLAADGFKEPERLLAVKLLWADIVFGQKDYLGSQAIFEDIYRQTPENLYPLRRMIECSLLLGDNDSLTRLTRQYAESLPTNPESLYSLTMLFLKHEKQDVLFLTTKAAKAKYASTKPEIAGLMALYEALVYAGTQKNREALSALDEASHYLGSLYGADHPISQKIQELYSTLH